MASKYKRVHGHVGVYTYQLERRWRGEPDLCFFVNFKADGKLRWEKVGCRSEGITAPIAAELRSRRLLALRHHGEVKTARQLRDERRASDRTFAEIWQAYSTSDQVQRCRHFAPTRACWSRWLAPWLGQRTVASLTPADVEALKRRMSEAGKAPGTISNACELLRRLARWGHRQGMAPALAFTVQLPKVDNERTEFLNPEQMQRFLATLAAWPAQETSRMLQLAMYSGLRRGEIWRLEDRDVDRLHAVLWLRSPKGGKTCSIPLSEPVDALLKQQAEWRDRVFPGNPLLFPGQAGRQRKDSHAVRRIKAAAGLPKDFRPFHGLRHHFAVTLLNSGEVTLDMVGELLTHKSSEVTRRYAQFLPAARHKAAALAARLVTLGQGEPAGSGEAGEG